MAHEVCESRYGLRGWLKQRMDRSVLFVYVVSLQVDRVKYSFKAARMYNQAQMPQVLLAWRYSTIGDS